MSETDAALTRMAHESMSFTKEIGLEIVSGDSGRVVGRASWAAQRCTSGGALHGGYLMALADSMGGMCAFLNLPEGAGTATIESKTNFFRAVRDGRVTARARPLHVGRSYIVVQTDLTDTAGKPVAQVTQTQAVLSA